MALAKTLVINGFDVRVKYKLTVLDINTRGAGPVRRSSTIAPETMGRLGQVSFPDEKIILFSGYMHDASRSALLASVRALVKDLQLGQDGRRVSRIKFEDSQGEMLCQYAGDFRMGEVTKGWFTNTFAEISFSVVVQAGAVFDQTQTHTFTGIGDKVCKSVLVGVGDFPVRPRIIIKNNNAAAITALTLLNYSKRRIVRKLTGTMSSAFVPKDGAWGRGLEITTGTHTYSFATSKLMPWNGAWTIGFRFKRVFTAGSDRVFWETSSGNNRLRYNNTTGDLELVLNNVVSATFNSALSNLSTSAFTWVVARNEILTGPFSSGQNIFINGAPGNAATDTPPSTDPGANLYIGTTSAGGSRAEGIFDEIVIWNRALADEEISYLNGLSRPHTTLEDTCLYVDFEDGVDGIGYSNQELVFSSISLAQNDSLVIDCERQTAKKMTNGFVMSDQLSAVSGEFPALEPKDNMVQLLQTGGGATGTDLTFFYAGKESL